MKGENLNFPLILFSLISWHHPFWNRIDGKLTRSSHLEKNSKKCGKYFQFLWDGKCFLPNTQTTSMNNEMKISFKKSITPPPPGDHSRNSLLFLTISSLYTTLVSSHGPRTIATKTKWRKLRVHVNDKSKNPGENSFEMLISKYNYKYRAKKKLKQKSSVFELLPQLGVRGWAAANTLAKLENEFGWTKWD